MVNGLITLIKKDFEERKEKYITKNETGDMYHIDPVFIGDEPTIEDGNICVDAPFWDKSDKDGDYLGFIRIEIPITPELAISIIDLQVKKYNKVKTMLEATK